MAGTAITFVEERGGGIAGGFAPGGRIGGIAMRGGGGGAAERADMRGVVEIVTAGRES